MTDTDTGTDVEEAEKVEPDERREKLLADAQEVLGDAIIEHHLVPGRDLWLRVDHSRWLDVLTACRDELDLSFFDFLTGLDWMIAPWGRYEDTEFSGAGDAADGDDEGGGISLPEGPGYAGGDSRFQVLVRLHSLERGVGIELKVDLDEEYPEIPTMGPVFPGADWHERVAYEMYGFVFTGHPHLVKFYLPGDFEGFPLRKDYPLLARVVKPWPGVVDVEPIPEHLEEELERQIMAEFEADGGES